MASCPTPSESSGSDVNPVAPVSYTLSRPYAPAAPRSSRLSNGSLSRPDAEELSRVMNTQEQYTLQQEPSVMRIKTTRDPTVLQKLAQQMEYQRSLAQISQGAEDADPYTEASGIASYPSSFREHPFGEQALNGLSIPSPLSPSTPRPSSSFPQVHRQGPCSQNQQASIVDNDCTATYDQRYHQYHQHPQYAQHPSQPQQALYSYYGDNTMNSGYTQPHPGPSTDAASALYRSSTSSSVLYSDWSYLSSPSVPPSPFSTSFGPDRVLTESQCAPARAPRLSIAAQLLIDFNPGVLSTIAVAFRQKMLANEFKRLESANYGLEFPVTFTGKEAVDVVIELTTMNDRRHALAITRSLERQQLFFGGGDVLFDSNNDQYFFSEATLAYLPGKSEFPAVPTGVFPYSTKCYSYDCVPGNVSCYSYLCPNRRNIGSVLGRHKSDASTLSSQEKVWANSVPASVVASASKQERNRQEAIFEVVNTEHNYVRDLELMEEIFITPLRAGDIVDPEKVDALIEDTFLNYKEIQELNKKLLEAMRVRQQEQPLVESIGDILLPHVLEFEQAYMRYIPRIALSEFASKREEARNPKFAQFLKDCTRHPEARRLGLRHFVGQPYQRIPRYPLLLSEVVKRTDESVADRVLVQEVVNVCTELGKRIDACMPEGARQVRLLNIQDKIGWKRQEVHQDLKITEKMRKLHFECLAKRKAKFDVQMFELRIFLFDHMLLMTKERRDKLGDKDDPIPLELMDVWADDSRPMSFSVRDQQSGRKASGSKSSTDNNRTGSHDSKHLVPVTVEHRGRRGRIYTLFMATRDRQEFVEKVEAAKKLRQDAVSGHHLFQQTAITQMRATQALCSMSAHMLNFQQAMTMTTVPTAVALPASSSALDGKRVTCSSPYMHVFDGRRRLVIGTEDGIYTGMEDDPTSIRVAIKDVSVAQISVLEEYHLLLVLSGKVLKAYDIRCLDPGAEKSLQTGQSLGKSVQYYTAGVCAGKTLVITMKKKSANESHFTAYEPIENAVLETQQSKGFSLSFSRSSKSEWFKLYREFYVASDSSQLLMLSKMVCVVCPKGFEVLLLENLVETRVYPTREDPEFAFLLKRPESVPVSMFKVSSEEFLMCYSDFAFIMTKKGTLAKKELIEWEGRPEAFAMAYPYIIAFESGLIEVRHIETGALEQLILGDDIRLLHSDGDTKETSVMQVHKTDPNRGDLRQLMRLSMASLMKTALEPIQYQPKSSYSPQSSAVSPSLSLARAKTPVVPPSPVYPPAPVYRQAAVYPASPVFPPSPLFPPSPFYPSSPVYPSSPAYQPATIYPPPNDYPPSSPIYPTTTAYPPPNAYPAIIEQPHKEPGPRIPPRPSLSQYPIYSAYPEQSAHAQNNLYGHGFEMPRPSTTATPQYNDAYNHSTANTAMSMYSPSSSSISSHSQQRTFPDAPLALSQNRYGPQETVSPHPYSSSSRSLQYPQAHMVPILRPAPPSAPAPLHPPSSSTYAGYQAPWDDGFL
ncbi:RHO1 GDP-GTP exchange protein 2 [Mortierella sp. GBA30]|nr:RHO1 GDP-GTP exchange protein 2 [Mortierella sp. GBA30]